MVPISPEIYSGGAVIFDTRSLFDYQQRLADRKAKKEAAEQEALDNYLKELGKTPDPYGIRKNDIAVFNQKLNNFRELSNNFRKAPKDLEKRLKLQEAADDLKVFVARSKEEKEKDKSYNSLIADLAANPEKRKTTNLDKLIADKTNQDLPLDFPGVAMLGIPARQDKDFNPNYYKPAPVSIYDLFEKNKSGIELGPLKRTTSTDKDFNYIAEQSYSPEDNKSIALRIGDRVKNDPNLIDSFKVKGKSSSPEYLGKLNIVIKKYFPKMEVDDEDPISIAIAESLQEGERRKAQKTVFDRAAYDKSKPKTGFGFGVGGGVQVSGNAFDEITNIVGTKKGVKIENGVAILKNKPYEGTVVMKGSELPLSVVAPLRSSGLKIYPQDEVTVVVQNGKVLSIKPKGKNAIGRSMMENAQLKFSTEPQKGPQMRFGQGNVEIDNDPLDLGIEQ